MIVGVFDRDLSEDFTLTFDDDYKWTTTVSVGRNQFENRWKKSDKKVALPAYPTSKATSNVIVVNLFFFNIVTVER